MKYILLFIIGFWLQGCSFEEPNCYESEVLTDFSYNLHRSDNYCISKEAYLDIVNVKCENRTKIDFDVCVKQFLSLHNISVWENTTNLEIEMWTWSVSM